jgi:hypothetical protein
VRTFRRARALRFSSRRSPRHAALAPKSDEPRAARRLAERSLEAVRSRPPKKRVAAKQRDRSASGDAFSGTAEWDRTARWRAASNRLVGVALAARWPRLEAFALQPESARREIAQPSVALTLSAATTTYVI